MAGKTTGLAAFARKGAPAAKAETEELPLRQKRRRGRGETVALTVRVRRADWERLHQLAVSEGVSLQELALVGLSKVFAAKGLPGIDD